MFRNVLTMLLAGGKGTRLDPLTRDRAKPAVPFGGLYRVVDFPLSNCINSGLRKVFVLTQFKSRSLDRHIRRGWNFLSSDLGEWIEVLPPQQRIDDQWYAGTADALYQNIYSIEKDDPDLVLILAGDHVYKMDYGDMIREHRARGAALTVGGVKVPVAESDQFGILQTTPDGRIVEFVEKPPTTAGLPDDPESALGSMGIYIFNTRELFERLCADAADPASKHDFGKNVIPAMIREGRDVFVHRFRDRNGKPNAYWRDVGTLDAFYEANMDLVSGAPELNLYDDDWPIRTFQHAAPPPKFVHSADGPLGHARRGEALDSIVSGGCIVSGGQVRRSLLSPMVRVNSYAVVEGSILLEGVDVGRYCRIRNAIIDKDVKLPPYTVIGFDRDFDLARGFTVTEGGIVVVPKAETPDTFQAPNRLPY